MQTCLDANKVYTIGDALDEIAANLESCEVGEARLLAEYALVEVTGIERLRLTGYAEQSISDGKLSRLKQIVTRLAKHEPLQYVLGYTEFMGLGFKTDRRALIPRPETEQLVEIVLEDRELWSRSNPSVLDVGTGTGCIAIALALYHPHARLCGVDNSDDALALARENAQALGCEHIEWFRDDLLGGQAECSADAVVANPPYVPARSLKNLDRNIRDYEPRAALDGGRGGLSVIARLVEQAAEVLNAKGKIYLEIGDEQGPAVSEILSSCGFNAISVGKDLAGHNRFAIGSR